MAVDPLPEFDRPPVVEVALSWQFEPLELNAIRFGQLWERFRDDYPRVEEQPPLPPQIESFDTPVHEQPRIRILPAQFSPRYWLLNADGDQLVQVQGDRFIFNWRRSEDNQEYPRYNVIREQFLREFRRFAEFVGDEQIGEILVNQCEISYINHISQADIWETPADLGRVFSFWTDIALPETEGVSVTLQSLRRDDSDRPLGRLYVNAQSAVRATDGESIFALTLIGRGPPASPSSNDATAMFDAEHEWIVRTFAEVTTPDMHQVWERRV